tara:strand:- start:1959 stop:2603 length:645 start_codon:yes stop_codon:yes gene_type:complete
MKNYQALLGNNPTLISMGPLGPISSDVNKMVNTENYVKPVKKEETKSELVLDPTSGRMVAKDRVTGFWRPGAGFVDWLTGNRTDWDKRGAGTGDAHPVTGAGELHKDYEIGIGGETTKKTTTDDRSDVEKITGRKWEDYLKDMEGVQQRAGERKFKQEQLARLPDLAFNAAGGAYATALQPGIQAVSNIASSSRHYQFQPVQLPQLQNFASLLG